MIAGVTSLTVILIGAAAVFTWLSPMPGRSYAGPFLPLSQPESALQARLEKHVQILAGDIGNRALPDMGKLDAARLYLEEQWRNAGFEIERQQYLVSSEAARVQNIWVEIPGSVKNQGIFVVGAHYDTAANPGADDNASGLAALLELSFALQHSAPEAAIRFVAFVNEEMPFFLSQDMGSYRYAAMAKTKGERISGMFSLESIGYYTDEPGSQDYPPAVGRFYPDRGNFLAFVANPSSAELLHRAIAYFREGADFPSEGIAAPPIVPGVSWSDHWSFWEHGFQAVMLTDTAPFRNPNYHRPTDTPETLDYARLARVTKGIEQMLSRLANATPVER